MIFKNIALATLVIVQLFCVTTNFELYPFSPFPMYRGKVDGLKHSLFFVFLEDDKGNKHHFHHHKKDNSLGFVLREVMTEELKGEDLSVKGNVFLKKAMNDYYHLYKKKWPFYEHVFTKIIFEQWYWDELSEKNIASPDRVIVHYEKYL